MTIPLKPGQSGEPVPAVATSARVRRTDLDLLRILICGGIILAHAALIYAVEPRYHLKSDVPWLPASIGYEFMRATAMAVFFVLAGWSALVSLRGRGAARFVRERATRLLPPLLFGMVLFGSIIKYIELSHGRDMGLYGLRLVEPLTVGFFDFFPRNLTRMKLYTWSHLWFLGYLFLISLLLLPVLLKLARRVPITAMPTALMVYVPGIVLAGLLVATKGYWPFLPNLINDWANFAYFGVCFLIGAGLAAWPGFELRMRAEAPRLLMLLVAAFTGLVLCGESTLGRMFVGLTAWGAIGAGLGYAARLKPGGGPLFGYLSEATLPVYIIHHAPLLMLAVVIVPLALPVWLKIVLITVSSGAVSLLAYHWLVRPWPPIRWLMGMTAARKPASPAPRLPQTAVERS
jgi:glucan biosynthesis protein C